jgi:hypothetical protein
MTWQFRFGVHWLDKFTGADATLSEFLTSEPSTLAIVGPDGCGKSILALHLLSTFVRDALTSQCASLDALFKIQQSDVKRMLVKPLVFYASTDFSYAQAKDAWQSFGLDYPFRREIEICKRYQLRRLSEVEEKCDLWLDPVDLTRLLPSKGNDAQTIKDYVGTVFENGISSAQGAYFLDLQKDTAGDDWTYLNHLLGILPQTVVKDATGVDRQLPRLLVIDAVEGLEAFVGDRDAYGESRSRRSRIAQIVRSASAAGVHTVFVVEESTSLERLPEQFVSDTVIRLRSIAQAESKCTPILCEKWAWNNLWAIAKSGSSDNRMAVSKSGQSAEPRVIAATFRYCAINGLPKSDSSYSQSRSPVCSWPP